MARVTIVAFFMGALFAACSGTKQVNGRETGGYTREHRDYSKAKSDQKRMDRENYRQLKKMERSSAKQNKKGWDSNKLGNVFGL